MGGFDWAGVEIKLRLHGMWNKSIERGLSICEVGMLNAEYRARERESDSRMRQRRK